MQKPYDCEMRVIFQGSGSNPSTCIVSSHVVAKLLSQGSDAVVASLVDSESESRDLSPIPVVNSQMFSLSNCQDYHPIERSSLYSM